MDKKPDHERIWLEPRGASDRSWCDHDAWSGDDDGVVATEYVRADLYEAVKRDEAQLTEQFELSSKLTAEAPSRTDAVKETDVKVCPQCEGEGSYADGLDDAACTTTCTRCESNGWIVNLASHPRDTNAVEDHETGNVSDKPCLTCNGTGYTDKNALKVAMEVKP